MNALSRGILKSVALVALLITACLPTPFTHGHGKEVTSRASLWSVFGSGMSHLPGASSG
jgi:hypothetical protein